METPFELDRLPNGRATKPAVLPACAVGQPVFSSDSRTRVPRGPAKLSGIGLRISIAVNSTVLIAVACFITFDSIRETREHVRERTATLDEQAMTIHLAVAPPTTDGTGIQQFIDRACLRMSETTSPGHHIVVESGGRVLQSQPCRRASDGLVEAIRRGCSDPERRASAENNTIIVGFYSEDGTTTYVAEQMDDIRNEIRQRVAFRSIGVLAFGALLAATVHLIAHRLVSRPLRRLVRAIDAIRAGELGTSVARFNTRELDRLAGAVNEMSRSLAEGECRRRSALEQARRVQENLLPNSGEIVPGVRLAAIHRAADAVAGDYYDVLPLPDGTLICCVADVVGHGVPAAMVAAILKVLMLDAVEMNADPGVVIARVNERFSRVAPVDCFASLLVARWCPNRQILWYASAGHEPGMLLPPGREAVPLGATGTLLGVMPDGAWDTEIALAPQGSILVGLTDGVTEAMDASGRPFGRDRIGDIIREAAGASPEQVIGAIDRAVERHLSGHVIADDYTLMAVRFGINADAGNQ